MSLREEIDRTRIDLDEMTAAVKQLSSDLMQAEHIFHTDLGTDDRKREVLRLVNRGFRQMQVLEEAFDLLRAGKIRTTRFLEEWVGLREPRS